MTVGIPKERYPGETRVAVVPTHVPVLTKLGYDVVIEQGAGDASGYRDESYREKGAEVEPDHAALMGKADVLLTVRSAAANPEEAAGDVDAAKEGQAVIGFVDPYTPHPAFSRYVEKKISLFSMELMPRITRAQSMDALSSMANLGGYKAALIAAEALPKMFPMMMTAAGTIVPAKVFIVGVGVAGLQAIATAKRLGGVVSAYDVRPAVREQVESLGARFVEMKLDTSESEGEGGYAKAMDEEFYRKQREMMTEVVSEHDVVITTAAIPGKKSPVLVTEEMVRGMAPGSVIVDLAAERGGNCELTESGKSVVKHGVRIIGPENLPAQIPYNASQLYSKNITNFLTLLTDDGKLAINQEDEIVAATLVSHEGSIPNKEIRERLQLGEGSK